jgi:microcystin-dependent protein
MMETIRAEMYAEEQESTSSNATMPTSSHASSRATSPATSRATSPSPMRKISRRERIDENLQDISARMQQTGQVMTAAGSALIKNMKPDRKYQ